MARLVALSLTAVALCGVAAGCGGKSTARRDAVAAYILRVDAIEQSLAKPLLDVSKANRDFARRRGGSPAARRELVRAQATISRLDRRLRAVRPPVDAAKLHVLLLRYVGAEDELAGEVVQLARFIPAFTGALVLLGAPNAELTRVLGTKQASLATRAAALDRYGAALEPVIARLRRLDPPPASKPVWAQQIATLEHVRRAAARLADGLRRKRYAAIPALLHALNEAAVGNQSVAAQKAQIAAVVAYDNRIRALNVLGSRVSDEEARLQRTLG